MHGNQMCRQAGIADCRGDTRRPAAEPGSFAWRQCDAESSTQLCAWRQRNVRGPRVGWSGPGERHACRTKALRRGACHPRSNADAPHAQQSRPFTWCCACVAASLNRRWWCLRRSITRTRRSAESAMPVCPRVPRTAARRSAATPTSSGPRKS
eukprot:scaffold126136_cov36-Phaeocystis_antarctica.AAC.2